VWFTGREVYCDPPYLHETRKATSVYAFEMTETDHRELLKTLCECRGKVILSGYTSELYNHTLANWPRHTVDIANHSASGSQKERKTEMFWCNF
jgi:DNA adenine methylase